MATIAAAAAFVLPVCIHDPSSVIISRRGGRWRCCAATTTSSTGGAEGADYARVAASIVLPSVASIIPVGVRNMTSRGTGFVVDGFPTTTTTPALTGSGIDENDDDDDEKKKGATTSRPRRIVHLLTAAHVASPGSRLSVSFSPTSRLPDGLPATLVGRDAAADLALIRVEIPPDADADAAAADDDDDDDDDAAMTATTVPGPLQFYRGDGDDDDDGPNDDDAIVVVPPIGTLAFACGYPSGMDGAAFTMGIVCGTARGLEGVAPWMSKKKRLTTTTAAMTQQSNSNNNADDASSDDTKEDPINGGDEDGEEGEDDDVMFRNVAFVVTDASMAPGMSGGPLANVNGEVMGMCALVRPDLRALGNYAVSADACRGFLAKMRRRVVGEGEGEGTAVGDGARDGLIGGFCVVLFNDRMNKKERIAEILRNVAGMDEDAAKSVMMAAHTTGRGVVRNFSIGSTSGSGNDDARMARALAEELCESMKREDVLVEVEELS